VLDTKFHQSIAREPFNFSVFGEDEAWATEFTFWLCHKLERDIFGFIKVDLNEYVKDMGFKSKSNFQERIPNPHQFSGKSEREIERIKQSGEFIFDTKFHNMVYKMAHIAVSLRHIDHSLPQHDKHSTRTELLIKAIDVFIDKKNRQKIYLQILPSDFFLINLSRAYLMLSKESFTALGRSKRDKIQNLYLYISALRGWCKAKGIQSTPMDFDKACEIIGIDNYSENKSKKQKLKAYLTDIQISAPDLSMEFFFSPNGKWNYKPILVFKNNLPYEQTEKNSMRIDLFDSILQFTLAETYLSLYPNEFETDFKTYFSIWMKDKEKDVTYKKDAYCRAHLITWNKKIDPNSKQVLFFLEHLKHQFEKDELI
jgi:hypothetical protein